MGWDPNGKGQFLIFGGWPAHWISLTVSAVGCAARNHSILNNGMTARLLQPTAMLLTIRCHITLSPWKIRSCNAFLFYYSVPSTVLAKVTNLNGAQFYFITNKNRLQKYSGSPVVSLLPPGLPSRIIARTVSSELLGFFLVFLIFRFWAVRSIKLAISSAFERT